MQVDKLNQFSLVSAFEYPLLVVGLPHRPPLGPRFAQHDGSVLQNFLNRPSMSSLVYLGSLCPWGVQNVMRVVQRLSVILATYDQPNSILVCL